MKPKKHPSLFESSFKKLLEPVSSPVSQSSSQASVLYNTARKKILGEGCKKDFIAAHHLIETVLKLEITNSELRYLALTMSAMNYVDGRGVPADQDRALSLLHEAASFATFEAAFNLGLFFDGRFGPVRPGTIDHEKAAFFYSKSSKMGHLGAQTNLALLHIQKKIANFNTDLGWYLLDASSQQGDKIASEAIKELNG